MCLHKETLKFIMNSKRRAIVFQTNRQRQTDDVRHCFETETVFELNLVEALL